MHRPHEKEIIHETDGEKEKKRKRKKKRELKNERERALKMLTPETLIRSKPIFEPILNTRGGGGGSM